MPFSMWAKFQLNSLGRLVYSLPNVVLSRVATPSSEKSRDVSWATVVRLEKGQPVEVLWFTDLRKA